MSGVLTPARLRELLRHDPATGKLWWLPRTSEDFKPTANKSAHQLCRWWNTRFGGKEAFTASNVYGYRVGRIFGKRYYAHHVAWVLHHGEWPQGDLDHCDGNRSNNQMMNLRTVSHAENMRNKKRYTNNRSGYRGIFRNRSGKWQVHIGGTPNRIHLGAYTCFGAAIAARRAAEQAQGYHENHGRRA